jgi:outer membrane protein assembly factor BamC
MKKAKIFVEDGRTVIELDLNFDRAWSSVSKAMDASNIFTNDRDRSNGIFYVSYSNEEDGGFLSFLNFRKNTNENIIFDDSQFEVKIIEKNNKTYVRAFSKDDKIIEAEKLISIINESLS